MNGMRNTVFHRIKRRKAIHGFKHIHFTAVSAAVFVTAVEIALRHKPESRPCAFDLRHAASGFKIAVLLQKAFIGGGRFCPDSTCIPACAERAVFPVNNIYNKIRIAHAYAGIIPKTASAHSRLSLAGPNPAVRFCTVKIVLEGQFIIRKIQPFSFIAICFERNKLF